MLALPKLDCGFREVSVITPREQAKIDALAARLASIDKRSKRNFESFAKKKVRDQLAGGGFSQETYFDRRAKTLRYGLIAWQNTFRIDGVVDKEEYVREADAVTEKLEAAIRLNSVFRSADDVDQMLFVSLMTCLAIIMQAAMLQGTFDSDHWELLAEPWKSVEGSTLFLL